MRFIDIGKLKEVMGEAKFNEWVEKAKNHFIELKKLDKKDRAKYFKDHGDWTSLYSFLSELSHHKCWYSEAPENSCAWDVDHFRPKNRARNYDGTIFLPEGYWWLAYEWENFRLSGGIVNRRVKDKFNDSEEVYGKGDYFPLDLNICKPCKPDGDLDNEIPYLLDPTSFKDTTLIGFDKDGRPISNYPDGTFEAEKVYKSIEFLSLDHSVLNRNRKEVWENTENEIVEISRKLKEEENSALREKIVNKSFDIIRNLTSKKKPYSSVAINCLIANQTVHVWIKSMLPHLGS